MQRKKHNLANKIARLISSMLLIIFAALIALSLTFTRSAIIEATNNDLSSNSAANGAHVQEFMNVCQSTALSLSSLMQDSFAFEKSIGTLPDTVQSVVYQNLKLNSVKKDLESQMIATAKNAVRHNTSIVGIGIMFEPNQYTKLRESYAMYFTADDSGEIGVSDVGEASYYTNEAYYTIATDKNGMVFTPPYIYRDMSMVSGAMPIIIDGKHVGVINIDVTMDEFNKLNLSAGNYPSMGIQVITGQGIIAFDSKSSENIGKNITEFAYPKDKNAVMVEDLGKYSIVPHRDVDGTHISSFYYPLQAGTEKWQTVTTVSDSDINRSSIVTTLVQGIFCIISLVILIAVVTYALRNMLRPIGNVVDAATSMAEGNLDIKLNVKSNDEIGVLSETFTHTCESLKSMITDISRVLDCVANNDLTAMPHAEYKGDFSAIRLSIENILSNLNRVMHNINGSSRSVSGSAEQIAASAQALSQGATEQAASIEELSASIEDISGNSRDNAGHAKEARAESVNSKTEIELCNDQMREMIKAMNEIHSKSGEIGKIIKTVEDIAFQTNILALNAAVEAARAGVAGKGFAVVADEVRNLAGKSAGAVKGTTLLIEETVRAVENGSRIADSTAKSMATIVEDNDRVTHYMDSIASDSGKQSESIDQITMGMGQISGVVQTTSATAEESAAASAELLGQAQILKSLVDEFKLKENDTGISQSYLPNKVMF